ncbi:MAG: hypothetical protein H6Q58_2139 [Firmicutes bacterium]|nr:hypothetical protein [Bacillota bacterium]
MATYLVDYENVKTGGLNGITKLMKEDKVIIFYSENADTLTFGLHRRINESVADISFIRVEVGCKNALDFQLVSYLGYLVAQYKDEKYFIISNDNGFTSVKKFWHKKKVLVEVAYDLSGQSKVQEEIDLKDQVVKIITNKEDAQVVMEYIQKYKTKQGIYNALVKKYDNQKAGQIYKSIKPLITHKKGTEDS